MLVAETKLIDAFLTTVENTLKMKQTACSHFKFKDILSWYKLLALFLVLLRENGGHELYEEVPYILQVFVCMGPVQI